MSIGPYDIVTVVNSYNHNIVYQCVGSTYSQFCGMVGFEPGLGQTYSDTYWSILGSCTGEVGSLDTNDYPGYESLIDLAGCNAEYYSGKVYDEGDRVSKDGITYQCMSPPVSLHCSQAGYEPDVGTAWERAWSVIGTCTGTITPTSSPNVEYPLLVGPCYDKWDNGETYEQGDKVSVTVSTDPERKVSYLCKGWPWSLYCEMYKPNEFGGTQGWDLIGLCDGTGAPSTSPVFVNLKETVPTGCPLEWSSFTTNYEADDKVTLTVSTNPERKIVYKCRDWPNTGYCNQAGFKPDTKFGHMAWAKVGYCEGSIAPTPSPTPYMGNADDPYACTYKKNIKSTSETVSCTHGSTDCTCQNIPSTVSCSCATYGCSNYGITDCSQSTPLGTKIEYNLVCTKPKIVETDLKVDNWSSSTTYIAGDVVRVGADRYKCKDWPYTGFCNQESYNPSTALWSSAWSRDGECPMVPTSEVFPVIQVTKIVNVTYEMLSELIMDGITVPRPGPQQDLFIDSLESSYCESIPTSAGQSVECKCTNCVGLARIRDRHLEIMALAMAITFTETKTVVTVTDESGKSFSLVYLFMCMMS